MSDTRLDQDPAETDPGADDTPIEAIARGLIVSFG